MALRAGTRRLAVTRGNGAAITCCGSNRYGIGREIRSRFIDPYPSSYHHLSVRHLSTPIPSLTFVSSPSSKMSLTPPQPPPSWDHSPSEITRLTNELIAHDRALQDKIGALDPKDCNFESVSFNYSFLLRFPNNCLFKVFVSY